ncbi:MAG: hypothetical protein QM776_04890 [Rhodocyclaceae bacterium]
MRQGKDWKFPLHILTACGATLLLLALAAAMAWNARDNLHQVLLSSVNETVARTSVDVNERVQDIFQPAQQQVAFWTQQDVVRAQGLEQRLRILPFVQQMFATQGHFDAFYIANPAGEFLLFRPLRNLRVRQSFEAPEAASLLVQARTLGRAGQIDGEYLFFDDKGRLVKRDKRADYRFDPRERPWYRLAQTQSGAVLTKPYVFYSTRSAGTTLAQMAPGGGATVGVDITLEALQGQADKLRLTENTQVAFLDAESHVVARDQQSTVTADADNVNLPDLASLNAPALLAAAGLEGGVLTRAYSQLGGRDWEVLSVPVATTVSGTSLRVVMAVPHDDLFRSARKLLRQQMWVTLLLIALSIPFGYWLTQRVVTPLRRAILDTQAVAAFDFSPSQPKRSRIAEVDQLSSATEHMKSNDLALPRCECRAEFRDPTRPSPESGARWRCCHDQGESGGSLPVR